MAFRNTRLVHQNSLLSRYSETLGELTLRRNTELAIRASKAESDLANRAKSALLATMSHELRTPLNSIIGFSDLIKKLKSEPQSVEKSIDYATHISNAGRHLLEVVSDVLDLSKIEGGSLKLSIDEYSIADIARDCADLMEERIAQRKQTLELKLAPDLPYLFVDAKRIQQILLNILSNANKFTPEGGHILLLARRATNGGVTVVVVDSGCGMTEEQVMTAIRPFGQVQSHFTRTQEGAGLGLPIAIGLTKLHGGQMHIEVGSEAGTSVVLTLPPGKSGDGGGNYAGGGERRAPRKGKSAIKVVP
jgi:two-component system, cell cycle sensor histidine kinase PleC